MIIAHDLGTTGDKASLHHDDGRLLADTDRDAVQAISFSGQMMGAVLLDAAYRPVRPALIWGDHRSSAQATRPTAELGVEPAYSATRSIRRTH